MGLHRGEPEAEGLRLLLDGAGGGGRGRLDVSLAAHADTALAYVLDVEPAAAASLVAADGSVNFEAVREHVAAAVAAAERCGAEEAGAPAPGSAAATEPAAKTASPRATKVVTEQRTQREGDAAAAAAGGKPATEGPPSQAAAAAEAAAAAAEAETGPAGPAAEEEEPPASGRLGPRDVAMAEVRGSCDVYGGHLLSRANFSTLRGTEGGHVGDSGCCRWQPPRPAAAVRASRPHVPHPSPPPPRRQCVRVPRSLDV